MNQKTYLVLCAVLGTLFGGMPGKCNPVDEITSVVSQLDQRAQDKMFARADSGTVDDDAAIFSMRELISSIDQPGSLKQTTQKVLSEKTIAPTHGPRTLGEDALFLTAIETQPQFRSPGWERTYATLMHSRSFAIRLFALSSMPVPINPVLKPLVAQSLNDRSLTVQRLAFELVGRARDRSFAPAVVNVVRTTYDSQTFRHAVNAGFGCAKFETLEALADRLDDQNEKHRRVSRSILSNLLAGSIENCEDGPYGSGTTDGEVAVKLKSAWKLFLSKNEVLLRRGLKMKVGDRRLTTDLCPPGYRCSVGWKQEWPDQFQLIKDGLDKPFDRSNAEQCRERAQVAVDCLQSLVDFDNMRLGSSHMLGRARSNRQPRLENQLLIKALTPLAEAYRSNGEAEAAQAVTSQINSVSRSMDKRLPEIKIEYLSTFSAPPSRYSKYSNYY